jgi:alkanesulfonate monooxygenase
MSLPDSDIEFIGYINTREVSEIRPGRGPLIDPAYVATVANAHESAGFDRALIAFHSTSPDSLVVAAQAASATRKLGLMIAHRPGFASPTVAARQFATLDQFAGGRVAVHVITGGDDAELARDGDTLTKDERYARTSEYLDVMRRAWASRDPFDYQGRFYSVKNAWSEVRPFNDSSVPVYFGGASKAAIQVGARHADVYALWGEDRQHITEIIGQIRSAAKTYGRTPRFSLSVRPIIADTEDQAWARAEAIFEKAKSLSDATGIVRSTEATNTGSERLRAVAALGERVDERLWTKMAALTGGRWNSTSLVGTPSQVAEALLKYHELGVSTFLIRGYEPLEDALDYGRTLIPLTRDLVKRRHSANIAAE